MKRLILGLLLSSQVTAFANTQYEFIGKFQEGLRDIQSASFSNETCPAAIRSLLNKTAHPDWSAYTNDELKSIAKESISQSWEVRLALHKKLEGADRNCIRAIREAYNTLREVEDYLGEFAYQQPALDFSKIDFQKQPTPITDATAYPAYHQSPNFPGKFEFQNGDLMLARGVSFISAMISQITDQATKFSHVIMVNVNPKTGEQRTIESYIGIGVASYEMPWALRNENSRLLVLRPKDQKLAAKAANYALDKAQNGDGVNNPIPYDYRSNLEDHSRMSCAEVARASYDWASGGKVMIPAVLSQTSHLNSTFAEKMSIDKGTFFAPDDLATDPNFELVLDWTDYRLIRDSRQRDAIIHELMSWVNSRGYNFHDTTSSFIAKKVILPSRKTVLWPLVQKIAGLPDLDPDFPKDTLGIVTVLKEVGNDLLERVKAADERHFAMFQRPMTPDQLKAYVENIRVRDLQSFIEGRETIFHHALRPDNVKKRGRLK